jgi:ATPase components of various ABC-type transport systems, contain duplicated ATPase
MNDKEDQILLEVENLRKYFAVKHGVLRRKKGWLKAVDGVSFELFRGETLGLVGESGCGKSTTGRIILRLIKPEPNSQIFFHDNDKVIDIAKATPQELKYLRTRMQIIFQDPYSSLNPWMKIGEIIAEPLLIHKIMVGKELTNKVHSLLEMVGLDASYAMRYPHEFSGGQRQRIGIARALALNPTLVVCDEPVSSLDVSVQAQVINLLVDLQERLHLSYIFIAHDLGVVRYISRRVAVMYLGRIVEIGSTEEIFHNPAHPYTEALLSSMLSTDPDSSKGKVTIGRRCSESNQRAIRMPFPSTVSILSTEQMA